MKVETKLQTNTNTQAKKIIRQTCLKRDRKKKKERNPAKHCEQTTNNQDY